MFLVAIAFAGQQELRQESPFESPPGTAPPEEVRKRLTIVDSAEARNYVQRLGRQLAAELPGENLTYTFEIVADETNLLHEPIATPRGDVFVPVRLFSAAEDGSEFAGMLAHAMAHAAAKHGARVKERSQRSFSRGYELEADLLGAQAMARAGYDPAALVRYIKRLQMEPSDGSRILSPFPPRKSRIAHLEKFIRSLPGQEYQRVRVELHRLSDEQSTEQNAP